MSLLPRTGCKLSCDDAAKLEATLLRDHKDAMDTKNNILAQKRLLQEQPCDKNSLQGHCVLK